MDMQISQKEVWQCIIMKMSPNCCQSLKIRVKLHVYRYTCYPSISPHSYNNCGQKGLGWQPKLCLCVLTRIEQMILPPFTILFCLIVPGIYTVYQCVWGETATKLQHWKGGRGGGGGGGGRGGGGG